MVSSSQQYRTAHDAQADERSITQGSPPVPQPPQREREDPQSRLVDQLTEAWEAGQLCSVDEFFVLHPEALADPETAVRLIYEEFCLRQEAGQQVEASELSTRFPQWRSELEIVLHCHELIHARCDEVRMPAAGERIGGFQLLLELGRGAVGRVFLATQPALSDRPVVIKIVPCRGDEHLALARLQHTSIVPLYLVEDDVSRNMRLLCMPYVGGITLARLLDTLAHVPIGERSGRHLANALREACDVAPIHIPREGPALQYLPHASYAQAICWIGACLAEALQYAHSRGLVHLDIKPSNVLLAGDGQPMLLDFHLAHEVIPAGVQDCAWLGGTPGFMSPEQDAAITAIRATSPIPLAVDGRSDIYSLGLLLYQLLGEPRSVVPGAFPLPDVSDFGASVPASVIRTVQKCLARDPRERYGEAGLLANDLRGCLMDPPAPRLHNRPWLRWAVATGLLTAVVLWSVFRAGVHWANRADVIERHPLTSAQHVQHADQLHVLVDGLRFLDSSDSLSNERLQMLAAKCRTLWNNRHRLLSEAETSLPAEIRQRVRSDLLDLAILGADLHVRTADAERINQARREALEMLSEAEDELGSSVVLVCERQVYETALGLSQPTNQTFRRPADDRPRTAWEHYAIGRTLLRSGARRDAAAQFRAAVTLDPASFWPNFFSGLCAYRLDQYEAAVASFSACIALAPDRAECFHNRGLAYQALGQQELADRDFRAARHRKPVLDAQFR